MNVCRFCGGNRSKSITVEIVTKSLFFDFGLKLKLQVIVQRRHTVARLGVGDG